MNKNSKNVAEFLDEAALRELATDSLAILENGKNEVVENSEVVADLVIQILKQKQAETRVGSAATSFKIKNSPKNFARTHGHLPNLKSSLIEMGQPEEFVTQFIGTFRDKIVLQTEDLKNASSVSPVFVSFAKKNQGKSWTLTQLRNFEKLLGNGKIKSFFDRNLSQGDTQSNLKFFFTERKEFFEKELGKQEFETFKNAFEWNKAEEYSDVEKKHAAENFLQDRAVPWRINEFTDFHEGKKTPLRKVDEKVLFPAQKEKNETKFTALKRYLKTLGISVKDFPSIDLFRYNWGSWEQEGRFLTHFLKTSPGEFGVQEIQAFLIGGEKIGGGLYKGIFKYLFPKAQESGFRGKEWPFIFAHLINKKFLDFELFLKNPFRMNEENERVFWQELSGTKTLMKRIFGKAKKIILSPEMEEKMMEKMKFKRDSNFLKLFFGEYFKVPDIDSEIKTQMSDQERDNHFRDFKKRGIAISDAVYDFFVEPPEDYMRSDPPFFSDLEKLISEMLEHFPDKWESQAGAIKQICAWKQNTGWDDEMDKTLRYFLVFRDFCQK
ncbi:hypothetical protein HN954_01175 [bacterium]|jgi:hypothetical protein|nr:hypothetical protein [bacterium]MBT6832308.1 hypothetical protein [bacterium]MBT6996023.1 hypothetical protein [bacterium]MBT7772324.1 hypothetical protein [bacterium]